MADRLEMHVLAVGQGSCGLVARYDSSNQLVQLDLCDCGRRGGGMASENLQRQMQLIHSLMERRAEAIEEEVDLYLDHIIISHKDIGHISLFNEIYLLKDLTPAPIADRQLTDDTLERIRTIPTSELQTGVNNGGDEDDSELLQFRAEYTPQGETIIVKTASVEYRWESQQGDLAWISVLDYKQHYDGTAEQSPKIAYPLSYKVYPDITLDLSADTPRCVSSSFLLDASPDSCGIYWRFLSKFQLSDQNKEEFSILLQVSQQEFDSKATASIKFYLDPYLRDGFNCPLDVSEGFSVAFSWEECFFDDLNQFMCDVFSFLESEGLPFEIPSDLSDILDTCLRQAEELCTMAFLRAKADFLQLCCRFQMLSKIDFDMICEYLFACDDSSNEKQKMAVGKIYLGGLQSTNSRRSAANMIKKLFAFCSLEVQAVSGIVQEDGDILLIQMPFGYTQSLSKYFLDTWTIPQGLQCFPQFSEYLCGNARELR